MVVRCQCCWRVHAELSSKRKTRFVIALQWRHNERNGVSTHQPCECLLNHYLRHRLKKTSKLRVTGLCAGNSPVTGVFPAQMASTRKMFPFDDVIIYFVKYTNVRTDKFDKWWDLRIWSWSTIACNLKIVYLNCWHTVNIWKTRNPFLDIGMTNFFSISLFFLISDMGTCVCCYLYHGSLQLSIIIIIINEDLTTIWARLLATVRSLKKKKLFQQTWIYNGNVEDKTNRWVIKRIRNNENMQQLLSGVNDLVLPEISW